MPFLVTSFGPFADRSHVDTSPKPKGLRERFVFWLVRNWAPRLTIVEIRKPVDVFTRDEAEAFWSERVAEWTATRADDRSVFQAAINEETGELV